MNDPNGFPGDGRRRRRASSAGAGPGLSAARGAALVALAVIVGIVLLNAIDDGNNGPVGDGGSSSTTTTTTTTVVPDGTATSTTTAKAGPRAPAEVTVRVFNASGSAGVAGTLTNTLKAKGYQTLLATNAPLRKGTVVYAKAGATPECTTLATLVTGAKVQAMPNPAPAGAESVDCAVLIGS